jgi:cell division protein FtsB
MRVNSKRFAFNMSLVLINTTLYLLLVYFIYHSLQGERGIFAYQRLKTELAEKHTQLESLTKEKELYEKKLRLIQNKRIDTDLLDELAKRKLGVAEPEEELVIIE